MKQRRILTLFVILMFSTAFKKDEPPTMSFCNGIKMVHQAFKDGDWTKVKGSSSVSNQYVYTSLIDIEELTDEYIDGVTGTSYNGTYKKVNSVEEQQQVIMELVQKLESCVGKKAKKSKFNGYEIKMGKVTFKALYFGKTAVMFSIWDFKN